MPRVKLEDITRYADRGDFKALVKALDPRLDEMIRQAAAGALGALGERRAVEPLIQLLADGSLGVRRAAAEGLGRLGDVRAFDPLVEIARSRTADPALQSIS